MVDTSSTALFYTLAVIISVGVVGNVISLVVFHRGKQSSSLAWSAYFKCLALADNFILLVLGMELLLVLSPANIYVRFHNEWLCKFFHCICYFGITTSTWIMVVMTVDRTLSLCFPLKFRIDTSAKWIYIKICCVLLALLGISLFHLTVVTYGFGFCYVILRDTFSAIYFHWYIPVLVFIVPFVINGACNTIIVCTLWKRARRTAALSEQSIGRRVNAAQNFTFRVLAITIFHMVSVLPYGIFQLMFYFKIPVSQSEFIITNVIFNLNSGVNFFLYLAAGGDFRSDLKELCKSLWVCCKPTESNNINGTRVSTITDTVQ